MSDSRPNTFSANASPWTRALVSVLLGLIFAGFLMQISGYNARDAYSALWTGATGLQATPPTSAQSFRIGTGQFVSYLDTFQLAQALSKVTPLLFTGLAVMLGLRAGLFNIGATGQMLMGALGAAVVGMIGATGPTGIVSLVHIPLTLLAGTLMGALWGALAGLLKAKRGVHEVLSTIMLNYIALNLTNYLITHNLKDKGTMAAQTPLMAQSAWLTPFVPGSNLTAGLLLGLLACGAVTFLIQRTSSGFEIRAVGAGPEAAQAAGIAVPWVLVRTMALSGALAGIAGAVEVMGVHHRFVSGVASSYGFDGIAVALLAGLSGGGTLASGLFFGMLANGAALMQLRTDVPKDIAIVVQAMVIVFVGLRWRQRTPKGGLLAAVSDTEEGQRSE